MIAFVLVILVFPHLSKNLNSIVGVGVGNPRTLHHCILQPVKPEKQMLGLVKFGFESHITISIYY